MCGISGVNWGDKTLISKMTKLLEHRGPDQSGTYVDKNVSLGHARLSIIDLSERGKQPMSNEDGDIWLVYNGEIYNFASLREKLIAKGHRFKSDTDSEVVIHAYEEYGEKCVELFNGMFAFCIWDSRNKKFFLARDRAGIKPLFYTLTKDNEFLFASEIKSILAYDKVRREVNGGSLHYFFNLRYVPLDNTMFSGIKKLLPGHTLTFDGKELGVKKYFELKINVENKSEDYYVKKLYKTLHDSVKRHLVSDVPIGCYLSSGMDSSTIVAFASQHVDNLKTFCMGFGEDDDEFELAKLTADHFGTDHKELVVTKDLLKEFPKTIWHLDEPRRNTWPYFISELVAKNVKVVLGGIGGDEVLGGYIYRYYESDRVKQLHYRANQKLRHFYKFIPVAPGAVRSKAARQLIKLQLKNGRLKNDRYLKHLAQIEAYDDDASQYMHITHANKFFSHKNNYERIYWKGFMEKGLPEIRSVFSPHFKKENLNLTEKIFLAEFYTKLMYDFLPIEDSTSMAHSLESRVPFLDNEVVDLCFKIPSNYKVVGNTGKVILRKTMKNILPNRILTAKKAGFIPNMFSWYKNILREIALQTMEDNILIKNNVIKKDFIYRVLKQKPDPKLITYYNLIFKMLSYHIWHKLYIENNILRKPVQSFDKIVSK